MTLNYLKNNKNDGDILYLYYGGEHLFNYYLNKYKINMSNTVFGVKSREDPQKYLEQINLLRGNGRVWVFFPDIHRTKNINEEQYILFYLDHVGKRITSVRNGRSAVYLYDLNNQRVEKY
jgi:hypothetical protein